MRTKEIEGFNSMPRGYDENGYWYSVSPDLAVKGCVLKCICVDTVRKVKTMCPLDLCDHKGPLQNKNMSAIICFMAIIPKSLFLCNSRTDGVDQKSKLAITCHVAQCDGCTVILPITLSFERRLGNASNVSRVEHTYLTCLSSPRSK